MIANPIRTEQGVRAEFWRAHSQFRRLYDLNRRQNQYPCDVRCAFCDFVDMLAREGRITEALASKVTL